MFIFCLIFVQTLECLFHLEKCIFMNENQQVALVQLFYFFTYPFIISKFRILSGGVCVALSVTQRRRDLASNLDVIIEQPQIADTRVRTHCNCDI